MKRFIISTTHLKDNAMVFLSEEHDERSGETDLAWDKDFSNAIKFNSAIEAKEYLTNNPHSYIRSKLTNYESLDGIFRRSGFLTRVFFKSKSDNIFNIMEISITPVLKFKESEVRIPHKFETDPEFEEYVRLAAKFKRD